MLKTSYVWDCFGISDVGLVRERNEDVWAAFPDLGLFLLADGMGGHAAGEIAAQETIDYFASLFKKWKPPKAYSVEEIEIFLRSAIAETNRYIHAKSTADLNLSGMGTTLCALYFLGSHAFVAHVGDSRIYRFRKNQLQQLTIDHSLVSEMIALGVMEQEAGKSFPYKHILTRAVGTQPIVEPSINHFTVEEGDLYFLASDGLTNFVTDDEIKKIISTNDYLEKKGYLMVDLAKKHGGCDNITVVLVKIYS